jgi:hypothetical protein
MTYYLLMPGQSERDAIKDTNTLGEASFGKFWSGGGLAVLMRTVTDAPDLLPECRIITDQGKQLTVEEFLTAIQRLKVI